MEEKLETSQQKSHCRCTFLVYAEVFADPVDENTVYVLNAPALKSIDGGKTFTPMPTPHGDNHHLWIHPQNNKVMINSNDGGANVSMNGGKTWSTQRNQPTAQFYRVIADAQVPYHVYGGQQDNSAIGIKSRTYGRDINWKDWYSVAGCESAFLAFDPNNPTLVYGGCYQGIIERWQRTTGNSKAIKAYPELALGNVPRDFKYRFNWNAPILTDPKDPTVLFHAGNVVFKSTDQGQSWQVISPDLTKNEKDKQGPGGVPFTNEAAGGENYNTLMSLAIALQDSNELWAGSDDGLLHLTRDGGKTWQNITPKKVTDGIINSIELSVHQQGRLTSLSWDINLWILRPMCIVPMTMERVGKRSPRGYKEHTILFAWFAPIRKSLACSTQELKQAFTIQITMATAGLNSN